MVKSSQGFCGEELNNNVDKFSSILEVNVPEVNQEFIKKVSQSSTLSSIFETVNKFLKKIDREKYCSLCSLFLSSRYNENEKTLKGNIGIPLKKIFENDQTKIK
jgi:hypothetical protein